MSLAAALTALAAAIPDEPGLDVEICGHCFPPGFADPLSGSRDRIPSDLLASVAAADPFHWGPDDKFRQLYSWLAPRIVAALAHDQLHVDEALVASRLQRAGALRAGTPAGTAHDAVMRAMWVQALNSDRRHAAVNFLEYAAGFHPDLEPYLSIWHDQPVGSPDRHAAEALSFWLPELLSGEVNLGWSEPIDISVPLTAWVMADGALRALRHGLDDEDQAKLALLQTNNG